MHLLPTHLIERSQRLQIQIVDAGKIHGAIDDLAGTHFLSSGGPCQNLLNGVHEFSSSCKSIPFH